MHIKIKALAFMLAALIFIFSFSAGAFAAVDEKAKRAEIESLSASALAAYKEKTGASSFYGNCGIYMSYLLNALGIDGYLGGHNGNQWYDAYTDGQKLGGYTVVKVAGKNCIQEIYEKYGDADNVMVSYTHSTGYSNENPGAGHVVFINTISGGKVYFTESYNMYDYSSRSYVKAGNAVVMSIEELAADHESLYGDAIGALWFVKGDAPEISVSETGSTLIPSQLSADKDTEITDVTDELLKAVPYTADPKLLVISNIAERTTVGAFVKSMPEISVIVRNGDGKIVVSGSDIATGMSATLCFMDEEYTFTLSVKGDVNGDGRVTSADARISLRYSARLEPTDISDALAAAYDFNGDGRINTADTRQILRTAAKIQSI